MLSEKYFYLMMFLYQQIIPLKYINNVFNGYDYKNIYELLESDNMIHRIIDTIETGKLKSFVSLD